MTTVTSHFIVTAYYSTSTFPPNAGTQLPLSLVWLSWDQTTSGPTGWPQAPPATLLSIPTGSSTQTQTPVGSGSTTTSSVSLPPTISTTTAAKTTTSAPKPSTDPEPPAGASTGTVVGAAIGSLAGGLILGLLLAWLLFRRKRSHDHGSPANHYTVPVLAEPKQQQAIPGPRNDSLHLEQFLLDALPDKDLSGELRSLSQLIQTHVENNYHLHPVQANSPALAQAVMSLGIIGIGGSSLGLEDIVGLAIDPRTRHVALQHVISQVVFTSVDFSSRSNLSMLPPPIVAFLQSIPAAERGPGNAEAISLALSKWRALSAFLLHPNRSQRGALIPSDSVIIPQASGLVNALNAFLRHFVSGDEASIFQQTTHLQAVITECTRFGYVLFSQPGEWRFVHKGGLVQQGFRSAVVCSGLDKVSNRDGVPYDVPHRLVAPLEIQV